MAADYQIKAHQQWLGFLQPDGLVVSPAALVQAQVFLDRNTINLQEHFRTFVAGSPVDGIPQYEIADIPAFFEEFFGWPAELLCGRNDTNPLPGDLHILLQSFGETLSPTYAFSNPASAETGMPWIFLIKALPAGTDLDAPLKESHWTASENMRFERLLRETKVPAGIITNGAAIRLVYAPRGENSGRLTFKVGDMMETAGRPILGAMHMLLCASRLLTGPVNARLPALLQKSREFQSQVSEKLAGQVLDSLYALLRGFQAADEHAKGALLREALERNPDELYRGLLTVLLRLVFLLYAEDRELLPASEVYAKYYSVHGLFERLRRDYERNPDTMDQRFGAWAQLLVLFRAVHKGSRHPQLAMPAREGFLFNPGRYPFLEGDLAESNRVPLVSDGVLHTVLENLMMLDGERLSYRTLDVEQIGSVYEAMVGFSVEVAGGPMIALKAGKSGGAPVAIRLDDILAESPVKRGKYIRERTDQNLTGAALDAVNAATTDDELLAALENKIARNATPAPLPVGGLALQPSDERRKSGSHYTPRQLTGPVVEKTLAPILARLGENPAPEQILDLKVCDPAMGSGAFLVETARQLGEALLNAWHSHDALPAIPADEDEVLHAQRIVAQRCLYGVDRNPMAVDLAKLSLWLATLSKDHPFTFLDHALRCGDSLVGLTREQIADFHWLEGQDRMLGQDRIEQKISAATRIREEILAADDFVSPALKRQKLALVDEALEYARMAGDCAVAAFFAETKDKARLARRQQMLDRFIDFSDPLKYAQFVSGALRELKGEPFPVLPFHWEIEFPEAFDRANPGFDAFVGNPPFAGKNTLLNGNRAGYMDWLQMLHPGAHGNSDLVAHFFRRAFTLLRNDGCFGLIATNTIGQGDTRHTGLRWICTNGGAIYAAKRRTKWPGMAAVVVSIVWIAKGNAPIPCELDGRAAPQITAYLFHAGGHETPAALHANAGKSFQGSIVLGMGFTFDDTDTKGVANPVSLMHELIAKDPRNAERIFPYIGGEEVNDSPTHAYHRYVINFEDFPLRREEMGQSWERMDEKEQRQCLTEGIVPADYPHPVAADWPDLLEIVERKVKPARDTDKRELYRKMWWQYAEKRPGLVGLLGKCNSVIVISQTTKHLGFAFISSKILINSKIVVLVNEIYSLFAVVQNTIHEWWMRFFGSTLEDRLVYTPSDCFETFPFPTGYETNEELEAAGKEYYEYRAALMQRNNEGLTKTYNRFHDPGELSPGIIRLRELHAAMDAAVLRAYGWDDIATQCDFILDYEEEEDEDNARASRRRKPYRYRWSDETRDEVLARLLKLNAERAEEERLEAERAKAELLLQHGIVNATISKRAAKGKGGGKRTGGSEQSTLEME